MGGIELLPAERKKRIAEYVRKHNAATVAQLAEQFQVHDATIRRDLTEIEREGLLKRTHGGVVMQQWMKDEQPFYARNEQNIDEKMRIGKFAASLIEDGEHVLLDSGTTTLYIAKQLTEHSNLTVVTNDINVASELKDAKGVRVILTGGELYPQSYMLNGILTDYALQNLHVEKAFIGTPALHPQYGLTHPESMLVSAKQGMIKAASEIIVVTDHRKLGELALHTIAPIKDIHTLITGSEADEELIKAFQDKGLQVITV